MEKLTGSDITIAITVYDRRDYVVGAIRSALDLQSADRPRVIVVEDCGPDPTLREFIVGKFGSGIEYFRNQRRRGLFDNWNACIEACSTPWLCILHDDDFLEPTFVESMIELAGAAPSHALYYGLCNIVDRTGKPRQKPPSASPFQWHELSLEDWAQYDPVCFPGQLFNVAAARSAGGFRRASRYTADWEMWFKLAFNDGAAASNRIVANYREHHSVGRGTSDVNISGRKYAYVNMQYKRNLALLRKQRPAARFDRAATQKRTPMPTRFLLEHGRNFSPMMLRYNAGLLIRSSPPHLSYRLFQIGVRLFSWRSLPVLAALFRIFKPNEFNIGQRASS